MRNDTTDTLGRQLTKRFLDSGLSINDFTDKLLLEDDSVIDGSYLQHVPGLTDEDEAYATLHFIHEGAVVSAYTWPDKSHDWYCKY